MKSNYAVKMPFIGFIFLQSLLFGFGNPLTKIAYESVTPLWGLTLRFIIASLCFLLFFGKKTLPILKKTPPVTYLPAAICLALGYIAGNCALDYASATTIGFLMSMTILFVPLLAMFINHHKYRLIHLPAQLAAVLGLYLLCTNGSDLHFGIGELAGLLTAVFNAAGLVYSEKSLKNMNMVAFSTALALVTAVICFVFALIFDDLAVISQITLKSWAVIVYLAIPCTVISFLLQNSALQNLSSFFVSVLQCSQPILTAFCSAWILEESLSIFGIMGALIIILCIIAENCIYSKSIAE